MFPSRVQGLEQLGLISAQSCPPILSTYQLFSAERRRHVQQQCQQQLNNRSEGRQAAPVRGQSPEDQGTNPSTLTHKHGRRSRPAVEWRRQTVAEMTHTGLLHQRLSKVAQKSHINWFVAD